MAPGTPESPFPSAHPSDIAASAVEQIFTTPSGQPGLIEHQGTLYAWHEQSWAPRDNHWLQVILWNWLSDRHYQSGPNSVARYAPTRSKVADIVSALQPHIVLQPTEIPCWLDDKHERTYPPHHLVAFKDTLVNARTLSTTERTDLWLDPHVLPCSYTPTAPYKRWARCLKEWSDGDEAWASLLQRWFGYCLMPHRDFARWMLFHGKIRSGKGTIASVLRFLLGPGFKGAALDDLAGTFGLDGIERARVLSISEVNSLDFTDAEKVTRVLKNIIGRDPITINIKHIRQVENVVSNAAPMVQANEIPRLSNKARGLSSKMLILPFEVTFEGREQFDLLEELKGELPGIAAWAVRGAHQLERARREDPSTMWPVPSAAVETVRLYHLINNPFDQFLESRFYRSSEGYVAVAMILREWRDWVKANKVKMQVADNLLTMRLVQESSWDLRRARIGAGGIRSLRGLSLRRTPEDEL